MLLWNAGKEREKDQVKRGQAQDGTVEPGGRSLSRDVCGGLVNVQRVRLARCYTITGTLGAACAANKAVMASTKAHWRHYFSGRALLEATGAACAGGGDEMGRSTRLLEMLGEYAVSSMACMYIHTFTYNLSSLSATTRPRRPMHAARCTRYSQPPPLPNLILRAVSP